jgi:sporulation protein YqfC
MNRAQKLLQQASERLDIPGQIMAGLPKVELTGFSKISIEQHKGILEYSDEVVTVAVSQGKIRITGKGLSIRLMNSVFLVVVGKLSNVELIPGESHG